MSFSPAFDRPLPRIEASWRWRTNKERLFRCAAIRSPVVWRTKRSQQREQLCKIFQRQFTFHNMSRARRPGIANANGYAKFFSRSHDAVIRVYEAGGNVIETQEHAVSPPRVLTQGELPT